MELEASLYHRDREAEGLGRVFSRAELTRGPGLDSMKHDVSRDDDFMQAPRGVFVLFGLAPRYGR